MKNLSHLIAWAIFMQMLTPSLSAQTGLIDDFKTGPLSLLEVSTGARNKYQQGTGIVKRAGETKGVRQISIYSAISHSGHPHKVLASVKNGLMVVSSGYKMGFGLLLNYGVDAVGKNAPLNFNASNYSSINIAFEGSTKTLSFNINAKCCDGALYRAYSENLSPSEGNFVVKVPLKAFSDTTGFSWADMDYLGFVFQSTGATLGNDFAITRIWFE